MTHDAASPTTVDAFAIPLTRVRIEGILVDPAVRFPDELRGLLALALEAGVGDLPGALPSVRGDPDALADALALTAARTIEVRVTVSPAPDGAVAFTQETCFTAGGPREPDPCTTVRATAPRDAAWPAVGALLDGLAQRIGFPAPEQAAAARAPGSRDTYAELITGRAGAALLARAGAVAASAGDVPADLACDAEVAQAIRAVRIDPRQPLAQWTLARAELRRHGAPVVPTEGCDADPALLSVRRSRRMLEAARAATEHRSTAPWIAATRARAVAATGDTVAALDAWHAAERALAPGDLRFAWALARAALAAGDTPTAGERAEALHAALPRDPAVTELRVRVAERATPGADVDPLLEAWARAAPRAVEPVRRRVDARVAAGDAEGALAMLPALRARGALGVDALETAILAARGDFAAAARRAPADIAAPLLYRAAWAADPRTSPSTLPPAERAVRVAAAQAALAREENDGARTLTSTLLLEDPRDPDVWTVHARALEGLGRTRDASAAWGSAWERDPALYGGPVQHTGGGTRVESTLVVLTGDPAVEPAPAVANEAVAEPARPATARPATRTGERKAEAARPTGKTKRKKATKRAPGRRTPRR